MAEGESLESWLSSRGHRPQIAVRLLAHKIQSPQEWEAVQTLTVLEACMKNCGQRFHNEVGKFRFLNELIKVVSPKYLGDRVSEKVKTKVIELLYSWTVALPEEIKIKDAYQMLKKQGVLQHDPQIPVDKTLILSPPTRPKNAVFEDNEKSKLLARLLKSKNPVDLQEANKLIKNMVKEDEARMQKITKRLNTLEEVNNNVRLLNEMLAHYNKEESTEGDKELMTELYERCEKMRRTLFKLASETEDNDNSLGEILQASDDLSRAINSYKKVVQGQAVNGELDLPELPRPSDNSGVSNTETLIDLAGLDVPSEKAYPTISPVFPIIPPPPQVSTDPGSRAASLPNVVKQPPSSVGLLDVELLSLGLNDPPSSSEIDKDSGESLSCSQTALSSSMRELDMLGQKVLEGVKSASGMMGIVPGAPAGSGHSTPSVAPSSPLFRSLSPQPSSPLRSAFPEMSLSNVTVPLETIKPSNIHPVTAYDKNGFRILLHFAKDCPPARLDVLVIVISMISTSSLPITNVVLQAAVPKTMKVKLQPPSGTDLAPFNPILPPASITQIMLLANPLKEKVKLRYKLTFTMGQQLCSEMGEVDQFPPAEKWGCL
ncbi:hypothetical protein chiPu_0009993 [Chiloscyllium punctatum]|uniref:ADP-ribosylation factor-binding protein GGA3 n=1 Tax=Chiloscyllium punctatum TaxID=137246 RepID=A0A401SM95_CHIPU|nr:hypothetical protein [Chiloscyllium punctatum]